MQELRREARRLENELDAKLVQYSRLDNDERTGSSSDGSGRAPLQREIEREIEQQLQQLAEANDRMSREAANATSATTMHTLQRHREILHDFTQVALPQMAQGQWPLLRARNVHTLHSPSLSTVASLPSLPSQPRSPCAW